MRWAILNICRFDATGGARRVSGSPKPQSATNKPMPQFFLFLTIVAYVFSLGSYSRFLRTGREISGRLGTVFLALGLVAHYFALLERSRGTHTVPYHDIYGSLSLFGWLLALIYLGLEFFHRQRSVGAFVMPFVVAFFLAANLAPAGADKLSPPPAHGPIFAFHVTLSILAYAAFGLSFVLSLIFLVENRLLRNRNLTDVVWRLPSLEVLERMSRSSVLVGIVSIAIGTALGFVWVDRLTGQYFDPKYVVTLLVVLLYGVYWLLARTTAWRGARASRLCIFNFVIVVLSFTVVNLYLSHSHRYF
jgi:ABC-type uncharacterized transport system permease subunit